MIDYDFDYDSDSSNYSKKSEKSEKKLYIEKNDLKLGKMIKLTITNRNESNTSIYCYKQFSSLMNPLLQSINLKLNRIHCTLLFLITFLIVFQCQLFVYKSLFPYRPTKEDAEGYFLSSFRNHIRIRKLDYSRCNFTNITTNNTTVKSELIDYTFKIHSNEMTKFQQELEKVYMQKSIPYKYCPRIPKNLKGPLNATLILQSANLTNLVEFYDSVKTKPKSKKKKEKELPYVNKLIDKNKTRELWELWNSNDLKLLNVSTDNYGADGSRIQLGGYWKPKECYSNFKIAIIIPYRDRLPHLKVLLYYLHLILQRQMYEYRIFVVEPNNPVNVRFNKGRVMNAAFLEALRTDEKLDCFIFHDVDLIPEDDRILYSCPPNPRHLSSAIDKFDYILPYEHLVGGVFAISRDHYKLINGYSNTYWGWGAEDDDLAVRIRAHKLRIMRGPTKYSRFKMIRHKAQELNPNRGKLLRKARTRQTKDGVNSVIYKVIHKRLYTGFTHILVDIGDFER